MEQPDMYRKLTNMYRNPTKLSIVMLLSEYGKMTVTQMSGYIDVSRANLYHFVSQLVDEGFLNPPEVKIKKNYVEKYYTLNEETFGKFDVRAWEEHLSKLTVDELREMISTSLAAQSLLLKLAAEGINKADPSQIEHIREMILQGKAWFSYSLLSRKSSERIKEHLDKIIEVFSDPATNEEPMTDPTRLLIVFLPLLSGERF